MKIGLIPMAAKPYHAGHDGLVRLACNECDVVQLFVSLSDRKRPGEIPIYGKDTEIYWKRFIERTLPGNCLPPMYLTTSPVSEMWKFMESYEKSGSDDILVIYSDIEDILQYSDKMMLKYLPTLFAAGQIQRRGVDRNETVNVSGTKMRQFIASGDTESFKNFLPPKLQGDAQEILDILTHRNAVTESKLLEVSSGRRSDSLAKSILSALIKELKSPEVFQRISKKMSAQVIITADEIGVNSLAFEYVQLDFDFDPRLGMQEISTRASFVKSDFAPRIEVEISYPNRPFRLKDIADIYPELLENVRHELEHAVQSFEQDTESSPDFLETYDDFVKYYTDRAEIEAFVSGLMSKSKVQGKPLSKSIDEKIGAIVADAEDAGVSESQLVELGETLRSAYTKYAQGRYPAMK